MPRMFILKSNFLVGCLFKEGNELSRAFIYKFGKNIRRSTQDNQREVYLFFLAIQRARNVL